MGSPVGATYVRTGDRLTVYGSKKDVARFNDTRDAEDGAMAYQGLLDARAPEVAAAEEKRMEEERRRLQRKKQHEAQAEAGSVRGAG